MKLKGEYEKDIRLLNAHVQKFPSDYAYFQLGQYYRHIDKFNEAGKAFENAIEINGNKAKYWVSLGEVHFQLEEYEDAVDEALTHELQEILQMHIIYLNGFVAWRFRKFQTVF